MLVLSRRKNESIRIGQEVRLCVVEIYRDKVRLGIDAPHAVPVHREEVFRAIEREGRLRAAAQPGGAVQCGDAAQSHAAGILDDGSSIVIYQPGGAL